MFDVFNIQIILTFFVVVLAAAIIAWFLDLKQKTFFILTSVLGIIFVIAKIVMLSVV